MSPAHVWKLPLCVLIGAVFSNAAVAQYRENQPAVIQPERAEAPPDPATGATRAFRSAYLAAGRPRIALFWNMELSDQLAEQRFESTRIAGQANTSRNSSDRKTSDAAGISRLTGSDAKSSHELTITSGTKTVEPAKRKTTLAEGDRWQIETAFTRALRDAGVVFVDRSVIMRTTAAQGGGGGDRQTVEMQSLQGKADMLLEVLMTPDSSSPVGWGFKLSLKDIASGAGVAALYSRAAPQAAPGAPEYSATDRGFQRVEQKPVVTVQDVGRTLAVDMMTDFSGAMTPVAATSKKGATARSSAKNR